MDLNMITKNGEQKRTKFLRREQVKIDKDEKELIEAIAEAKQELDAISRNINFVSDTLLVDHFAFKLKAAEVRYRYLVSQAKQMGIENHMYVEKMYSERYYR